jgi:hypothetical protein
MKLKINLNTVKDMAVEFTGQVKEKLKPARAVVQKVTAVVVSGVIAVGCGVPVASAAAEDTIDPSRTGTMIIHKYDVTAAQENGVDLSQIVSTGEQNPDAEDVLANYAQEGAQFSPSYVGEIATYSQEGEVIVTYAVPDNLASILELKSDEAVWTKDGKHYYSSTRLNTAMQEGLEDNTNFKNKLEDWCKGKALKMSKTDSHGVASLSNLPLGLYLIVETEVPENVHTTVNPYLMSLPSTDVTGNRWFYEVHSYPKNQNNDPILDKLVSEDGTFDVLPKKEVAKLMKEQEKLEKNLGGIRTMEHIPDVIFVVDPKKEKICVNEAQALGITLIGIADTNCDPDELDYIIPGNDDAIRAVKLLCGKMADAVIEARQGEENVDSTEQDALAAESAASEAEQAAEGTL